MKIVLALLILAALVYFLHRRSYEKVPVGRVAIVVDRTEHRRIITEGRRWIHPFREKIRCLIDIREMTLQSEPEQMVSADGTVVHVAFACRYQVTDALRAAAVKPSYVEAIERFMSKATRTAMTRFDAVQILADPGKLAREVTWSSHHEGPRLGVRISDINMQTTLEGPSLKSIDLQ